MIFNYLYFFFFVNILFFIGVVGFSFYKMSNFYVMIAMEMVFLAINLNFFFSSVFLNNLDGLLILFFVMVISGGEMAVFLSFFIVFYKSVFLSDMVEKFKNVKN